MTSTAAPPSAPTSGDPAARRRRPWWALELLPPVLVLTLGILLLRPGHGLWFDELFTA